MHRWHSAACATLPAALCLASRARSTAIVSAAGELGVDAVTLLRGGAVAQLDQQLVGQ
jgi:hypothetical protein